LELALLIHERIDVKHQIIEDKIAFAIDVRLRGNKAKWLWRIYSSQARPKLHKGAAEDRGLSEARFAKRIDLVSFRGGRRKPGNRSQGCGEPSRPCRSRKYH
jgi:hypothetical protein